MLSETKDTDAQHAAGILDSEPILESSAWVYRNLICEFGHYDCCLVGLVNRNGERWLCKIVDQYGHNAAYKLRPIKWTEECSEYLDDYRQAYAHWFHEGGKRPRPPYTGWPLGWFAAKWQGRNPIIEAAEI